MIVLVTDCVYLKADKVHSIYIKELVEQQQEELKRPTKKVKGHLGRCKEDPDRNDRERREKGIYTISIQYIPHGQGDGVEYTNARVKVCGYKETKAVIKSLIAQLQKQDPDLLDRVLEDEILK